MLAAGIVSADPDWPGGITTARGLQEATPADRQPRRGPRRNRLGESPDRGIPSDRGTGVPHSFEVRRGRPRSEIAELGFAHERNPGSALPVLGVRLSSRVKATVW